MSVEKNIITNILNYSYGDNLPFIKAIITEKIHNFIKKNSTISFVMPAFPGKSPNNNSCFSFLPGKEEMIAIETILQLQRKINECYKPGCIFNIINDGHFFYNLGITRSYIELDAYVNKLKNSYSKFMNFYSIKDLFKTSSFDDAFSVFEKTFIDRDYQIDPEYLKHEILFLINEFSEILFQKMESRTQKQKKCKNIAIKSFYIKNGISKMIEKNFPESIRLSVHYQHEKSLKMGFKLIPNAINKGTPWFNILYILNNKQIILGKKDWDIDKHLMFCNDNEQYYFLNDANIAKNIFKKWHYKINKDVNVSR